MCAQTTRSIDLNIRLRCARGRRERVTSRVFGAGLIRCQTDDQRTATTPDIADKANPVAESGARIDTERLSATVKVLASDEFQGRALGTPGGRKTIKFLIEQFAVLGLKPGGESGSWVHTVPMIRAQVQTPATMKFRIGGTLQTLLQQASIEASTARPSSRSQSMRRLCSLVLVPQPRSATGMTMAILT